MIRLYVDESFQAGQQVRLPKDELKYLRSVRRSKGQVEIFNRQGQIALGEVSGDFFQIKETHESQHPVYPVHLAVGLPDSSVMRAVALSVSELGVQKLSFFNANRSQAAKKRLETDRWEKLAIESARQCARGRPLEIDFCELDALIKQSNSLKSRICLDESSGAGSLQLDELSDLKLELLVLGPEGGWTEEEREKLRTAGFEFRHLPTPILRVATAATLAAGLAVLSHSNDANIRRSS